MKLRNGLKSRNYNFSLSDNNQNNTTPFISGPLDHRSSIVGIAKNYETDTGSLFADIKTNLNDSSFNEQILDKNKIHIH